MSSRPRFQVLLAGLAVAATLTATGCGDLKAINQERSDSESFALSGDRLRIDADGTDVRIVTGEDRTGGGQAGDGQTVAVERNLTGKASQDGNATWAMDDDTLTLRVVCSGLVINCGALHIVSVPAGTSVEITSDGAVRAVELTGDLTATVDGWLRVEDPAGALDLTADLNVDVTGARSAEVVATSTGRDVVLSFIDPPGRVEARSTSQEGSVRVTLPEGPETYQVEAENRHGPTAARVASDPASERTIIAVANRAVDVRKGS